MEINRQLEEMIFFQEENGYEFIVNNRTKVVLFGLVFFLFGLINLKYIERIRSSYPPSFYFQLPFIGHLLYFWPFIFSSFQKNFLFFSSKLATKFGPIFFLRLGEKNLIFLNSTEMIKELFADHWKLFSQRGNFHSWNLLMGKDFVFGEEFVWSFHRKFIKKSFNSFEKDHLDFLVLDQVFIFNLSSHFFKIYFYYLIILINYYLIYLIYFFNFFRN